MKLAYADPPYLGRGRYYDHPDARAYDTLDAHAALLTSLDEFDGWAYSCSASSLQQLLPLAPAGVRVAAWAKTWVPFKGQPVEYTWEPVLFWRARASGPMTVDHLREPSTTRRGLIGAKPERFCHWVLDLLGFLPGDEVVDLFPGTGVLTHVVEARQLWSDEHALAGGARGET